MKRLRAEIVRVHDEALASAPTPTVDARLGALAAARRARSRGRLRARFVGASLVAAAALAAFVAARPRPLRFEVGAAGNVGVVGARMEAESTVAVPVRFSDGTEIILSPDARARVVSVATNGAQLVVERGRVHAAVVPRPDGAWVVAVGPYDVHVKGTRFAASWDPQREAFELHMEEGLVVVTSACLAAPRASAAGETLALSCAHAQAAAPPPEAVATPPSPPDPPAPSAIDTAHPPSAPPPVASATLAPPEREAAPDAAAPDWRTLLTRGDSRAALDLAESGGGFEDACANASAFDLMRLGDAARLDGRSTRAAQIYRAIRTRFAGQEQAATAAFHLGQLAFDRGGSTADARAGFTSYLAERPNGALAQEALGRLIEVEQRDGQIATARALAQRYLGRFPSGPHAERARALAAGP